MTASLTALSRRRALALAGGLMATAGASTDVLARGRHERGAGNGSAESSRGPHRLPVREIEDILQVSGKTHKGVFEAEVGRKDLQVSGYGIPFKASFEVHHDFAIQAINAHEAMTNGEFALVAKEIDPAIDALLRNGLVFQALHQHFIGLSPQIWHIHFRGKGDPRQLAKAIAAVTRTTGAPLPQKEPQNPSTPLDHHRLGHILGGEASVKEDGVVKVSIPRKNTIHLGGVKVSPLLGITTHVAFMPLQGPGPHTASRNGSGTTGAGNNGNGNNGGLRTGVAPDIAMTASEIDKVMKSMRSSGFDVGCLYNQETDEHPQLYFSHQIAIGDAEHLAHRLREALNHTDLDFKKA